LRGVAYCPSLFARFVLLSVTTLVTGDKCVSVVDDGGGGRARQRGRSTDCQHRQGGLAFQTRLVPSRHNAWPALHETRPYLPMIHSELLYFLLTYFS
jgi:hypothetical protein